MPREIWQIPQRQQCRQSPRREPPGYKYVRQRNRFFGWAILAVGCALAFAGLPYTGPVVGVLGLCTLAANGEPEEGEPDYHEDG
jgi:hypothetical protein